MIKFDSPITINPPPYSLDDKIIHPKPLVLEALNIVYVDNPKSRIYYAKIEHIPENFYLFIDDEYDSQNGNISRNIAEQRLLFALGDNPASILRQLFPKTLEEHPNGPGTILSKMIKSVGIKITNGCSCKKHAIMMNEQGNDWCENNINTIVGWLKEEASKRNLPFIDRLAKIIVQKAISKSRKLLKNNHASSSIQ